MILCSRQGNGVRAVCTRGGTKRGVVREGGEGTLTWSSSVAVVGIILDT